MKIILTREDVITAIQEYLAYNIFDEKRECDYFVVDGSNIVGDIEVEMKDEE